MLKSLADLIFCFEEFKAEGKANSTMQPSKNVLCYCPM